MENVTFPETSTSFLTALFKHPRNAESIYQDLLNEGYKKEDIILIMSKETQKKYFSDGYPVNNLINNKFLEKMGLGGSIGGAIGALIAGLGAIVAESIFILPGSRIVGGVLLAGLAGGGAGAIIGGFVGALVGADIPKVNIKKYENGIQEGGVIIGVTPLSSLEDTFLQNEWAATGES